VLAVEAGTRNSELLRRTAKMNMALDIRVYQCAAWHEKTTLRFTENNAWGSVTPTGVSQVPAERVDDIVSDLIDRVTCVKMDVEGAEPQAVRGMPKLLERDIDILYETNSHSLHAAGTTTQALQKQFTDAGFTNYLYHNGCLYLLAEEDTQPTTVMDCFATRRDPRRLGVRVSGRIPNDVMSAEMLRYVNYPESTKHVQRELARRPDLRTHALTNAIKHG
jgi:FkbM family methyltransferase